jgi:di/tripeptidase
MQMEAMKKKLRFIITTHQAANIRCTFETLMEAPAASISRHHPLVNSAASVVRSLGIKPAFHSGNTDGDVSLAAGIPTITLGAARGFATHSLEEKLEKASLAEGIGQVVEVVCQLDISY